MAIDVHVEVGLQEEADVADALDVREILERDMKRASVDGVKLMKVRNVGGGTNFDPLVADADYEAQTTRDALVAVGLIATSLLNQGFIVRVRGEKLIQNSRAASDGYPEPGVALIHVAAPLGMT